MVTTTTTPERPLRIWNFSMGIIHFTYWLVMLLVVLLTVGWEGTLHASVYTDFSSGEPMAVRRDSDICTEMPILSIDDEGYTVQLLELLLRGASVGLDGVENMTVDGTFDAATWRLLIEYQSEILSMAEDDPEYGTADQVTWFSLISVWDQSYDGGCAFDCAVTAIESPTTAFSTDPYDSEHGCCAGNRTLDYEWVLEVLEELQERATLSTSTVETCALPTLFNHNCLYVGCLSQESLEEASSSVSLQRRSAASSILPPPEYEYQIRADLEKERYSLFGVLLPVALITAGYHFLLGTQLSKGTRLYVEQVRRGRNTWRWIESAISSTLLFWVLSQVAGISHIWLLTLLASLHVCMHLLWSFHERSPGGWWIPFSAAISLFLYEWMVVLSYFFKTVQSHPSKVQWYIYTLIPVMFLLEAALPTVIWFHSTKRIDHYSYEILLQLLSMVTRLFFISIVMTASL